MGGLVQWCEGCGSFLGLGPDARWRRPRWDRAGDARALQGELDVARGDAARALMRALTAEAALVFGGVSSSRILDAIRELLAPRPPMAPDAIWSGEARERDVQRELCGEPFVNVAEPGVTRACGLPRGHTCPDGTPSAHGEALNYRRARPVETGPR